MSKMESNISLKWRGNNINRKLKRLLGKRLKNQM
jgi:hypothetical protein